MVHAQLKMENPQLTFQQLRKLERMDQKKTREQALLRIGEKTAESAGEIGVGALTALASFATGAGGYVLGLAAIHYFEKIARVHHPGGDHWLVFAKTASKFQVFVIPRGDLRFVPYSFVSSLKEGSQLAADLQAQGIPAQVREIPSGEVEIGDFTNKQEAETQSLAAVQGGNYSMSRVQYVPDLEGILSGDEGQLAKTLLTAAAAAGVAGSLLPAIRK